MFYKSSFSSLEENDFANAVKLREDNSKRLGILLSLGSIKQAQHDKMKGLSGERAQFELGLIDKRVAEDNIISDEVFADIQQQGANYAAGIHRQAELAEECSLKNTYKPAVKEFYYRRSQPETGKQEIHHIHIDPKSFAEGHDRDEMSIADYIRECMARLGCNTDGLKVRMFDARRLELALKTGTDRDSASNLQHVDGVEPKLMKVFGLNAANEVTYVSQLDRWSDPSKFIEGQYNAIIVFQGDQLYKIGQESNGFSAFLGEPSDAAIAIFSTQGIPLNNILANQQGIPDKKFPNMDTNPIKQL